MDHNSLCWTNPARIGNDGSLYRPYENIMITQQDRRVASPESGIFQGYQAPVETKAEHLTTFPFKCAGFSFPSHKNHPAIGIFSIRLVDEAERGTRQEERHGDR